MVPASEQVSASEILSNGTPSMAMGERLAIYKMFNTSRESTVGKSIFEVDHNKWEIPRLRELLEQIIPHQNVFEDYEIDYDFAKAGRKTLLLNARQIVQGGKETSLILLAMELKSIHEGTSG